MKDKIYLSGTFAYREDTLKNWQNANPVLEKGEPAIVRDGADGEWLKIGDGVTAWNDLPYKKGPRGDKGADGAQGPQGEAGKDAITDQTYSPESTNAQSGIAVAEAVANKEDKKPWTLLNDITLTESVSEINDGVYDKKYDEIWVEGVFNFDTDYGATSKTGLFYISPCVGATVHTEYWGSITNGRTEYFRAHGYRAPSGCAVIDTVHGTNYYVGQNGKQTPGANILLVRRFNQCRFGIGEESGKKGIRFAAGTTIKVWGR